MFVSGKLMIMLILLPYIPIISILFMDTHEQLNCDFTRIIA